MEGLYAVHLLLHAIQNRERRRLRLVRRTLRDGLDPFSMREIEFRTLFRISKTLARELVEELSPRLQRNRNTSVPAHVQVLIAIRFFATGSYQRVVGQDMCLSVGQSTVRRCIRQVSRCIVEALAERCIKFPNTFDERQAIKARFLEARGFPGVVGCIDCTHVRIVKPMEREEAYYNHHGRCHSLNVQAVCDHDLRILSLSACYPGSVHDQFIWNGSRTREQMERWNREGLVNTWLLGDSGYALKPFLLTPIRNAPLGSPEERYTQAHCQTRNCVERLFGVLKCTWRCLNSERVLCYRPEVASQIFAACATLHNLMLRHRLPMIMDHQPLEFVEDGGHGGGVMGGGVVEGENVRAYVVQQFFT